MGNACFAGPRPEPFRLLPSCQCHGEVLVPGNLPVRAGQLIEVESPYREAIGAKAGLDKGAHRARRGQFVYAWHHLKQITQGIHPVICGRRTLTFLLLHLPKQICNSCFIDHIGDNSKTIFFKVAGKDHTLLSPVLPYNYREFAGNSRKDQERMLANSRRQGSSADSNITRFDIFDCPALRSTKMIGTSVSFDPAR